MPPKKTARAPDMTETPRDSAGGMLEAFLAGQPRLDLAQAGSNVVAEALQAVVYAPELLQDEADYRAALQRWFGLLAPGGRLVLTVPHAFLDARQDRLPVTHRPRQQRLYTPASLLSEVEEALAPNSYRLRWLADRDGGYDYALDRATLPTGQHDIALVLERIAPPAWDLAPSLVAAEPPPEVAFEPLRTRAETMASATAQRILLLKLDHLGDFIMAVPAMRAVRGHFPDAHITLVVGEWSQGLARRIAIADELLIFDAFPRNTGEVPADVGARAAQFELLVSGRYDLAIDLRTFGDTRLLLRNVDAARKAGIGHRGAYPFLDIFLPVDPVSEAVDHAWSETIGVSRFSAVGDCASSPFRIDGSALAPSEHERILVWGPYRSLVPGDYLFQPFLEVDFGRPGVLAYDVAIGTERIAFGTFDGRADQIVPFTVNRADAFEFRLWALAGEPVQDFHFYGGKLIKKGAAGTLHQSEYLALLVELAAMRMKGTLLRAGQERAR